ncbi:hypothetical protein ACFX15_018527 [Malus domestica]
MAEVTGLEAFLDGGIYSRDDESTCSFAQFQQHIHREAERLDSNRENLGRRGLITRGRWWPHRGLNWPLWMMYWNPSWPHLRTRTE